MPILYEKHDATRRVTLTVSGELTVPDLIEAGNRLVAESAWSYGVLLDARDRTGEVATSVMMRELVEHSANVSAVEGLAGPLAIVPHDLAGFGMGRMLEMLNGMRDARQIRICQSIEEAIDWLNGRGIA